MPTRTIQTKFWSILQNNSGGHYDEVPDKGIGQVVCVEALDRDDAMNRLRTIIGNYLSGGDCPCCGPRWDTYLFSDDEGTEEPESPYGDEPLHRGYVHYLDGRIEDRAQLDD